MVSKMLLLTAAAAAVAGVRGFSPSVQSTSAIASDCNLRRSPSSLRAHGEDGDRRGPSSSISRHRFLASAASSALLPILAFPDTSHALVKGNAPPPKKKASDGSEVKCRNVEECQEMAEKAEAVRMQQEAERAAAGPKPQVAGGGTKYLDIEMGSGDGKVAAAGDKVDLHYKVLKLGKRSYDGLTGEGTVVFSRGYALEDDEKVPGDHSFKFTVGDGQVIKALNDAVPGMAVGGTRRISVTPQNGWEKNTKACDGGPGGSGTGGELKTDYVVVPTATMVEQEACFDKTKLPFPATYAQERRMAQRFDQSLIVEVQLVKVL
ncbi:hypothetical protein ACHAXT_003582 [Thalassiosira profunda]